MISFLDNLSQRYLKVSNCCNLHCLDCVESQLKTDINELSKKILEGTFFKIHKRAKIYNLVGGDPLDYSDLLFLCQFLSREGIKIRLWINSGVNEADLIQVLSYVDEVAVYIPFYELNSSESVGYLEDFESVISLLESEKTPFFLHYKVFKQRIELLPDLYDYIYDLNLPCVFHFLSLGDDALTINEQDHVLYYKHSKHIHVFPCRQYFKDQCVYIPIGLFLWRFRWLLYFFKWILIQFKRKFKV